MNKIAQKLDMSPMTAYRWLRLDNLIPEFLDSLETSKLLSAAYKIAKLSTGQQKLLLEYKDILNGKVMAELKPYFKQNLSVDNLRLI